MNDQYAREWGAVIENFTNYIPYKISTSKLQHAKFIFYDMFKFMFNIYMLMIQTYMVGGELRSVVGELCSTEEDQEINTLITKRKKHVNFLNKVTDQVKSETRALLKKLP
ncbi:hypothetical protein AL387_gp096 [Salmon gill poxvirus]|uniref:Uncharacterized protein n=1 Tax=Salmon gill poxvirus TaxID=1680908 RepID=A0A0H4Y140_9POXV|nr:hypothetical protein AL387_gp096 [Salmon gill poxvirus]AKR04220.1 hypothetical protein SGPV096 [Salmon gill poxvirus]